MNIWLMKSEPDEFSIDDLKKHKIKLIYLTLLRSYLPLFIFIFSDKYFAIDVSGSFSIISIWFSF